MRFTARVPAVLLLIASLAMTIETSCSQAPAPSPNPEVHDTAKHYQSKHAAARFHLVDGTTYATSNYAVTDSFVVINVILRDPKYYGSTGEHVYGDSVVTPPPASVTAPVKIPMSEIRSVDQWEPVVLSNNSKRGWIITGAVLAGLVAGLVIAIVQNND